MKLFRRRADFTPTLIRLTIASVIVFFDLYGVVTMYLQVLEEYRDLAAEKEAESVCIAQLISMEFERSEIRAKDGVCWAQLKP